MERQMHQVCTSVGSVQLVDLMSTYAPNWVTAQSIPLPHPLQYSHFDLLSHFSTFLLFSLLNIYFQSLLEMTYWRQSGK